VKTRSANGLADGHQHDGEGIVLDQRTEIVGGRAGVVLLKRYDSCRLDEPTNREGRSIGLPDQTRKPCGRPRPLVRDVPRSSDENRATGRIAAVHAAANETLQKIGNPHRAQTACASQRSSSRTGMIY
jgi:hypothetical protein